MDQENLLTAKQVANILGIHVRTLYAWLKRYPDMIKPKRLGAGRHLRFSRKDIKKYLEKR